MILHMKRRQMLRPLNTTTRMHCVNHRAQRNKGKGLLYKNSDFKVFSRIMNNSLAENSATARKACGVSINLVKNLIGWN